MEIHSNYNLGYVYERLGERVKAIAAYKQAIELKPDFAHASLRAWRALCKDREDS